jgi:hypothetical protein
MAQRGNHRKKNPRTFFNRNTSQNSTSHKSLSQELSELKVRNSPEQSEGQKFALLDLNSNQKQKLK